MLQGVAGLRHNHIPLDGLAMLSVVTDGLKSPGDLRPLPWMRSYISNFKLVAFISVTLCSQFDCMGKKVRSSQVKIVFFVVFLIELVNFHGALRRRIERKHAN